uniref:cellulose-binding domain-containing protein n=1 Tax=Streptomyces sp. HPF1205 TaxID=2873262 RepID=UPI001CED1189
MKRKFRHYRLLLTGLVSTAMAAVGISVVATSAQAATGCKVDYTITSQWSGGFGANVNVTNLGDPVSSWQVGWTFASGQTVTQLWNGSYTQSGSQVTVTNASYNGSLATGASTAFGFNGAFTSSNPVPSSFTFNGTVCTGSTTTSGGTTTGGTTTGGTTTGGTTTSGGTTTGGTTTGGTTTGGTTTGGTTTSGGTTSGS